MLNNIFRGRSIRLELLENAGDKSSSVCNIKLALLRLSTRKNIASFRDDGLLQDDIVR